MGASTPAVASDEPALQGVLAAVRTAPVATSLPYFARDWPGGSIQFLTGRNSAAAASLWQLYRCLLQSDGGDGSLPR